MKYIITETQLKKLTSLISETSEEEAWELVGQDHKVIKSVVSKKGYENDESSVEKLIPIIDNLPTEEFDYAQLRKFHNIENKEDDKGLLRKMRMISKTDNPRDEYERYMKERDEGEDRNRGYDPVKNFDRIVSDSYESPVALKVNDEFVLIGGRTRIYASVAAGKPIKIKILTPSDL
jgi:hypothetical protein